MKQFKLKYAVAAIAAMPLIANAAGLDRSRQQVDALFQKGNYAELSYAHISPKAEGKNTVSSTTFQTTANVGDVLQDYGVGGAALKLDAGDGVSFALLYGQPWGVETSYLEPGSIQTGTSAKVNTDSLTGLVGYKTASNLWLYGGVEVMNARGKVRGNSILGEAKATAAVLKAKNLTQAQFNGLKQQAAAGNATAAATATALGNAIKQNAVAATNYQLDINPTVGNTYVVGAAYEIPKIALRADVTYRSEFNEKATISESLSVGGNPVYTGAESTMEINFPQSVNLNFQTGIMPGTLLMTKFRWVNWKSFSVKPTRFAAANGGASLASYENDQLSGSIGIGRKLTNNLSGSVTVEYDSGTGEPYTALGPYGDRIGVVVGGKYKLNKNVDVSAGLSYAQLGDAVLKSGTKTVGKFADNDVFAVGGKIGYHF